jgi:hypothetical protein
MMCIAIIRERRRREHGKETLFRYNGREIDAKRIDRFVRTRFRDRILTEMELTQRKMTDSFDILQMPR